MFSVDFEPVGRRGEFNSDDTLLDCARQLSVDLVSICGGVGSCERCKVQVISGQVSDLTLEEEMALTDLELENGYRLACKTYPLSNIKIHVPPESLTAPQRTQVEGLDVDVEPDPMVRGFEVELAQPSLDNPQADSENLIAAINTEGGQAKWIDFHVLQSLSDDIRANDWSLSVAVRGDEVIGVAKPSTIWVGLAVDIGTTKVAGYLLDLKTGKTLASKGLMNPQISYGEDVVSRIASASKVAGAAEKLQELLVDALNQLAAELCDEAGCQTSDLADAVIVGNTAIHHLFLRLPVKQLGLAPYVAGSRASLNVKARDIGLNFSPGAYIHLLPNIAGYVGADHVSMLLATRIQEEDGVTLAIDIGTNTEICLNNKGNMTSVSCASGPAFEGAHIKFGMRAAPGAIEHVRMENSHLVIQTIGGEPAVGICGSGLLDIVAQIRMNGILNHTGRMESHPLVLDHNGMNEIVLVERDGLEPVTITQKDVRELQLAKGAIRLGIQALVWAEGLEEEDIERVIIAGAFGTFIDVESAITIGMLPDLPLERFTQVGNAAGTGARLALISKTEREKAELVARRDGYIELASVPDFNRKFAQATFL